MSKTLRLPTISEAENILFHKYDPRLQPTVLEVTTIKTTAIIRFKVMNKEKREVEETVTILFDTNYIHNIPDDNVYEHTHGKDVGDILISPTNRVYMIRRLQPPLAIFRMKGYETLVVDESKNKEG